MAIKIQNKDVPNQHRLAPNTNGEKPQKRKQIQTLNIEKLEQVVGGLVPFPRLH